MSTPFDKTSSSIPVTVVTHTEALKFVEPGARVLHLEPALHEHDPGIECVACAAKDYHRSQPHNDRDSE